MLKQGVHPKVVSERSGHASIQITLDTYSHVAPGLQEAAARGFDNTLNAESKLDKELKELVRSCIIAKLVPFFVKGNHRARRRIAGVPLWGLRPCRYGGFRRGIASPPSL